MHVVLDRNQTGPDASSSITARELEQMVQGIKFIASSLEHKSDKTDVSQFREVKNIFEKSLSVNKNLPQGHILTADDLEGKKPSGYGIPARLFRSVIGVKLAVAKNKYEFLKDEDLKR